MEPQKARNIFAEELFPHIEALKTYAYHLTYDEAEADDLVQETYLNAHKAINSFIPGTNAKAWLFRILRNAYINGYRKKTRQPPIFSIEEDPQKAGTYTANKVGSDDLRKTIFDKSLGDEVTKALSELPEEFREIIVMCDIEDLTYDEISKTLDLPLGTVRSRIFRARNMLKALLKNYATGLGYKDYRGGDTEKESSQE